MCNEVRHFSGVRHSAVQSVIDIIIEKFCAQDKHLPEDSALGVVVHLLNVSAFRDGEVGPWKPMMWRLIMIGA
jgi:hypothetical protein